MERGEKGVKQQNPQNAWKTERNNEGRKKAQRRRNLQSKQLRIKTKVQDTPN